MIGRAKQGLRAMRASLGDRLGLYERRLARLDARQAVILMYHRVLPADRAQALCVEPGMFVTPSTFERHVAWLSDAFSVIPLGEMLDRWSEGAALPDRACAITFDDGWRDNLEHALPALARHRAPATIFVVAGRMGTRGAFWPDEVCRRLARRAGEEQTEIARALGAAPSADATTAVLDVLKAASADRRDELLEIVRAHAPMPDGDAPERELLDWDEVAQLDRAGIDIESHGWDHTILPTVSPDAAERDLGRAIEALRERGLGRHGLLAYPSGAHDETTRTLAARVGHRFAVSTRVAQLSPVSEALAVPRLAIHDDIAKTRSQLIRRIALGVVD